MAGTGWALWDETQAQPVYGNWKLADGVDFIDRACVRIQKNIHDLHQIGKIDLIVFEEPILPFPSRGPQGQVYMKTTKDTVLAQMGLSAHIMSYGAAVGVRWKSVECVTWRKHFVGKVGIPPAARGKKVDATVVLKQAAMDCARKLGFDPKTHDVAEALGLLDYQLHIMGIQPPWRRSNVLTVKFA